MCLSLFFYIQFKLLPHSLQTFGYGAVRLIAERLCNFLLRFTAFPHDENNTVILRQRGKESVSQFRIGFFRAFSGRKETSGTFNGISVAFHHFFKRQCRTELRIGKS